MATTSNNSSNVRTINVPISSAQILDLQNTPVVLLAPPPSGYYYQFITGMMFYNYVTTEYLQTTINDLVICFSTDGSLNESNIIFPYVSSQQFLDQTSNAVSYFDITNGTVSTTQAITSAWSVYLMTLNGMPYILGDSTMNITMDYKLVKIA